jgi:hypothetical protein
MTALLQKAFEQAARLPDDLQDDVATKLLEALEDIQGEMQWDEAFRGSEDMLERLADRALAQFEAGRTHRKGFDEL